MSIGMRMWNIIPKTAKVKIEFFKNISLADTFIGLAALYHGDGQILTAELGVGLQHLDGLGVVGTDTGILAVLGHTVGAQEDVGSLALLEQLQTGGLVGDQTGHDLVDVDHVSLGVVGVLHHDGFGSLGVGLQHEGAGAHILLHGRAVVAGAAVGRDALRVDGLVHGNGGAGGELTHDLVLSVALGAGDLQGQVIDDLDAHILPLHIVGSALLDVVQSIDNGDEVGSEVIIEPVQVAVGAEETTRRESEEFKERIEEGAPFMTTSCCPAYVNLARKHIPELVKYVSSTGSPMHYTAAYAKEKFPDLPLVLYGHSMGSFIAREVLARNGDHYHAAIICGTGGPDTPAAAGKLLASLLMKMTMWWS